MAFLPRGHHWAWSAKGEAAKAILLQINMTWLPGHGDGRSVLIAELMVGSLATSSSYLP